MTTTRVFSDWEKDVDYDFDTSVEILRKTAIDDYAALCASRERGEFNDNAFYEKQLKEYADNFTINTRGSKYVKLINKGSVWGFVVKKDGDKFKRGDILKPASWAAPATNKARGNIFEEYTVQWTGPMYL